MVNEGESVRRLNIGDRRQEILTTFFCSNSLFEGPLRPGQEILATYIPIIYRYTNFCRAGSKVSRAGLACSGVPLATALYSYYITL